METYKLELIQKETAQECDIGCLASRWHKIFNCKKVKPTYSERQKQNDRRQFLPENVFSGMHGSVLGSLKFLFPHILTSSKYKIKAIFILSVLFI